jgi:hypothetical protein
MLGSGSQHPLHSIREIQEGFPEKGRPAPGNRRVGSISSMGHIVSHGAIIFAASVVMWESCNTSS